MVSQTSYTTLCEISAMNLGEGHRHTAEGTLTIESLRVVVSVADVSRGDAVVMVIPSSSLVSTTHRVIVVRVVAGRFVEAGVGSVRHAGLHAQGLCVFWLVVEGMRRLGRGLVAPRWPGAAPLSRRAQAAAAAPEYVQRSVRGKVCCLHSV